MPRLRGAPVLRRGRSVRVQLGGNAGYGSAPSELPVPARSSRAASPPRSSPSCWEGANTNHRHHPEETCSSSVFVFLQHFSLMSFCFVLSCFGGLSGVQESKYETKPEVGSRGPWRHQVLSCTPCCCQAPCPPLALMAHLSGQLLYWHNFRPEAGPCMLPVAK